MSFTTKILLLSTTVLMAGSAFAAAPEQPDVFDLTLGIAVGAKSDYRGSDDVSPFALPYIDAKYEFAEDHYLFFAPQKGLGYGTELAEGVKVGLKFDYEGGRDSSDEPNILVGMEDIDATVMFGPWMRVEKGAFGIDAEVLTDVGGVSDGTVANFGADYTIKPTECLRVTLGAGFQYASDDYMQEYFGVGAGEVRDFRPAYDANGGIASYNANLTAVYSLDDRSFIAFNGKAEKLSGDAADSPTTLEEMQYSAIMSYGIKLY